MLRQGFPKAPKGGNSFSRCLYVLNLFHSHHKKEIYQHRFDLLSTLKSNFSRTTQTEQKQWCDVCLMLSELLLEWLGRMRNRRGSGRSSIWWLTCWSRSAVGHCSKKNSVSCSQPPDVTWAMQNFQKSRPPVEPERQKQQEFRKFPSVIVGEWDEPLRSSGSEM